MKRKRKAPWDTNSNIGNAEDYSATWWEPPPVVFGKAFLTTKKDSTVLTSASSTAVITPNATTPTPTTLKNDDIVISEIKRKVTSRLNKENIRLKEELEEKLARKNAEFYSYINSPIECSFNLPRVNAQLERLMGTNVVRLTDRNYMLELRRRIHDDFKSTLNKRIENREYHEGEREKHLILNGSYTPENCPPRLVIVHSVVLAKEMERQRNLIMEGKNIQSPPELSVHPVFMVNQKTNKVLANKRSKLKTARQRNAEKLIRQGARWEKERLMYEALDKQKEAELKSKRVQALLKEEEYYKQNKGRGLDLMRIKNQDYAECELDLKQFLEDEREKMIGRFRKMDKKSIEKRKQQAKRKRQLHGTSDVSSDKQLGSLPGSYVDNSAPESQTPVSSKPTSASSKTSKSLRKLDSDELAELEVFGEEEYATADPERVLQQIKLDIKDREEKAVEAGFMLLQEDFSKLHYIDPMVSELKRTDKVEDMYILAEEIICGKSILKEEEIIDSTDIKNENETNDNPINEIQPIDEEED